MNASHFRAAILAYLSTVVEASAEEIAIAVDSKEAAVTKLLAAMVQDGTVLSGCKPYSKKFDYWLPKRPKIAAPASKPVEKPEAKQAAPAAKQPPRPAYSPVGICGYKLRGDSVTFHVDHKVQAKSITLNRRQLQQILKMAGN